MGSAGNPKRNKPPNRTNPASAESADSAEDGSEDAERRANGPFDVSEISSRDGYVDLGALLIAPSEGLQLRLEVEEATQRVVAVTMDLNGSSLQLQAFAAPKTEGLWDEIREQIGQSVGSQGGQVEEVEGAFGTELVAKLPAGPRRQPGLPGGALHRRRRSPLVPRGVLGGAAAMEREAAEPLESLFRQIVVIRGDSPMPPRDLLQLRLPKDASATPPPVPLNRCQPNSRSPNAVRKPPRLADSGEGQRSPPPARGCRSAGCPRRAGWSARGTSNRSLICPPTRPRPPPPSSRTPTPANPAQTAPGKGGPACGWSGWAAEGAGYRRRH